MNNGVKVLIRRFMIAGLAFMCAPSFAQEEGRWQVEILPGAAIPVKRFGGADLSAGGGAQGNISYRLLPHLATYGGWDWHRFATDSLSAGETVDVEETGYAFGVRFDHPLRRAASPTLVLRFGGTYNHVELENSDGDVTFNSGHGLGWEAGAGLGFRLNSRWQLTPGARFRSLSRDFTQGGISTPRTLRYVTFELGVSRSF